MSNEITDPDPDPMIKAVIVSVRQWGPIPIDLSKAVYDVNPASGRAWTREDLEQAQFGLGEVVLPTAKPEGESWIL